MTLKFSDGIQIDTSGELRPLKLHDGWYVVGNGMLIPMRDEEEVNKFIEERKPKSVLEFKASNGDKIELGDKIEWFNVGLRKLRKGEVKEFRPDGIVVLTSGGVKAQIRPPFEKNNIVILTKTTNHENNKNR